MAIYKTPRLFSSTKNKSHDATVAGIGIGGGLAANLAGNEILKHQSNGVKKESEIISKKLIKEAEHQGTKVYRTTTERSHYANPKVVKILQKKGVKVVGGTAGDYIASDPKRADVLAHELGHSRHLVGRSGSSVGKFMHKLYAPSKFVTTHPHGLVASYINGYDSGMRSGREKNGEKESAFNKSRVPVLSTISASPVLVSEFEASRQGVKALKKAGASSKLIKDAKLRLAAAGGTYAAAAGINAGVGYLGRYHGKKDSEKIKRKKK